MPKIIKFFSLLFLLAVLLLMGGVLWFNQQTQPLDSENTPTTQFVIPKGQSVTAISQRLADAGFIQNPLVFRLEMKRQGLDGKLQAGSFELSPSMSLTEIAVVLTQGTEDVWLTLLEGWRREEIAESLDRMNLEQFDKAEFLSLSATSEGMLFPDTYLVPKQVQAEQLFNLFTSTFDRKITQGLNEEIAANDQDFDQVLIMASLIEREARGLKQMKDVSGILWNRYRIGMPLQVDATLQYAKGYSQSEQSWWAEPIGADRQVNSPFNTYQNAGLPPRPISNPGIDAITAALEPSTTDYLFYIHDREGNIHFAETLDQHNLNIDTYLR